YLPYDLRWEEISLARRAELSERLYKISPYEGWSPAAWKVLAEYFSQRGDEKTAAIWRARADDAAKNSAFVWEPVFYLERIIRILAAIFASLLLYYFVLQR